MLEMVFRTLIQANAVSFRVEQASDLHEVAVAPCDVLVHGRLEQVRVLASLDALDALRSVVDEHRRLRVLHEVPHLLERLDR